MKLETTDKEIYACLKNELSRQNENLELIASENFTSLEVLEAQGSVLTNKYAEGYPGRRWYGGCVNVDEVESLAIQRCKQLFKAEHANVQAHSGTQANMAVFMSCLKHNDTVLAMDLVSGGHLSHGHKLNFSGIFYNVIGYGLNKETEMIDYDQVQALANKHKPKLILAGASAYPRFIDFEKFRKIADSVGAILFVDMAHIAGLVAAGIHPDPVKYSEFVSSTTHKTLRGPRGGFVLCRKDFAKKIDVNVFPGIQGGPLMHVIAAKAVAFKQALSDDFKQYQKQIVKNAKCLADSLSGLGYRIVSGGTDNHLLLVDLSKKDLTGKDAQEMLERANITVNKNLIPFDDKPATLTSGVRLGTPALTTRGMKEPEMKKIAELIDKVIASKAKEAVVSEVKNEVLDICRGFMLYPELL
ncbi:MAG: serine hydroxymethyltransferase [Candidatus Gygaella obscura]|nr:serine hydroxymethyltransferase [Candidatus Gygaella obscura]